MKAYYFTFPHSHISLHDCYVKVEAAGWNEARKIVVDAFCGAYFAFQYEESDFLPQIEKYKLTQITVDEAAAEFGD